MTMYRQGDVMLVRIDTKPTEVDPAPTDPRGVVLAEGETSGHHHEVRGRGKAHPKLFRFRDERMTDRVLVVGRGGADVLVVGGGSGAGAQHVDRHTPITIEEGVYRVRVQRRWDSATARSQRSED